jgi:hypothetical protein
MTSEGSSPVADDVEKPKLPSPGNPASESSQKTAATSRDEDVWTEDYEEHIDAEELAQPRPRKKRHYGGLIVLVCVVVFLIVWTVLSPKVLSQSGDTYLRSDSYANLSGFSGNVKTWSGNATWALSVSGNENMTAGSADHVSVLITKVSENVSNGWFVGTGLTLSNVSLYSDDGTFIVKMSNKTNLGVGPLATIPVSFSEAGNYTLYVYVKFTVYADMRIGYLPMKAVEMESERFTIHVQ